MNSGHSIANKQQLVLSHVNIPGCSRQNVRDILLCVIL